MVAAVSHGSSAPEREAPGVPPASSALAGIDLDGFYEELRALRREVIEDLGPEDREHLLRIERIGRACSAIGWATAWIAPNPVSSAALAFGRSARWIVMHHVGHRGYDKVPGMPERLTSRGFAKGWRRFIDWPDWMTPEAWCFEHNILHHFHTGEEDDPDLVERNTEWLHELPKPLRWGFFAVLAGTWRASYYAETTMRAWLGRKGTPATDKEVRWALIRHCWGPYALLQFGLTPALFLPLGPWAAGSALANSLMADLLTNLHTFLVVGPNHSGDDVVRFQERPTSKAEHFARQVIGSVNYPTGSDAVDIPHLWLNYQIEHHLFPDIPMRQYQRIQPKVKALCEKYGLPYIQESAWKRFKKMARVFVGDAKMVRG